MVHNVFEAMPTSTLQQMQEELLRCQNVKLSTICSGFFLRITMFPPAAAPTNCPAGTYGPIIGAKDEGGCVNCPVGTYQDVDGSYECLVCPENTFASSPGATQCTACGDGYEVSATGADVCNPCAAGTFRDASVSEKCRPCKAGTSSGPGRAGGREGGQVQQILGYFPACKRGMCGPALSGVKCMVCGSRVCGVVPQQQQRDRDGRDKPAPAAAWA
jgi:hypothetical protein